MSNYIHTYLCMSLSIYAPCSNLLKLCHAWLITCNIPHKVMDVIIYPCLMWVNLGHGCKNTSTDIWRHHHCKKNIIKHYMVLLSYNVWVKIVCYICSVKNQEKYLEVPCTNSDVYRSPFQNKTTFTKYCLTQWISKLPGSFEIHWVRQYV